MSPIAKRRPTHQSNHPDKAQATAAAIYTRRAIIPHASDNGVQGSLPARSELWSQARKKTKQSSPKRTQARKKESWLQKEWSVNPHREVARRRRSGCFREFELLQVGLLVRSDLELLLHRPDASSHEHVADQDDHLCVDRKPPTITRAPTLLFLFGMASLPRVKTGLVK